MKALNIAANAAIIGVAAFGVQLIAQRINAQRELANQVDDIVSSYKQSISQLDSNKGEFDSLAKRYVELGNGVDELGKNISLTTEEYSEYQEITNKIATYVPSLVRGFDDTGTAILNVKGNVEELIAAYDDMGVAARNSLLENASNVFSSFKEKREARAAGKMDDVISAALGLVGIQPLRNDYEMPEFSYNVLRRAVSTDNIDDFVSQWGRSNFSGRTQLFDLLKEIAPSIWSKQLEAYNMHQKSYLDAEVDFLRDALKDTSTHFALENVISAYDKQSEQMIAGVRSIAGAYLEKRFSTDKIDMPDSLKNTLRGWLADQDYSFYEAFDSEAEAYDTISKIIDLASQISPDSPILAAFDISTKFNGQECAVEDYLAAMSDARAAFEQLDPDTQAILEPQLGLDTSKLEQQYENMVNRLTNAFGGDKKSLIEELIGSLTGEEFANLYSYDGEFLDMSWDELQNIITGVQELAETTKEFTFTLEDESAALDKVTESISASATATGLSAEQIGLLVDRYSELDGYDPSKLFERTEHGIHLNVDALEELEAQYRKLKFDGLNKQLDEQIDKYNELTKEINNCNDAFELDNLRKEQSAVLAQINSTADLISQYKGLTSAYNAWQNALSTANAGDAYDKITSGFDSTLELRKKGLIGTDDFKTFAQLFSYSDLSLSDDKNAYANVFDSRYKEMKKYFTEGYEGCEAFLKKVHELNAEWASFDGTDWTANFDIDQVAHDLDISVEAVESIVKKLEDYNFEVNITSSSTEEIESKLQPVEDAIDAIDTEPTITWQNNTDAVDAFKKQKHTATGEILWKNITTNVTTGGKISISSSGASSSSNGSSGGSSSGNGLGNLITGAVSAIGNFLSGIGKANGTAYVTGSWGTKSSGRALGGELGQELVVNF